MTTTTFDPVLPEDALHAALSTPTRTSRPTAVAASLAFGWRAMLKIKHVPMQLFDVTAFPIMFVLLYTYLFGGALAGSPREYLQELLPGILVMTVAWITMYTGQGLNTDISKGVFDRFRSLPIWRPAVLVGMLLADAVRYSMASLVMISLGVALGFRPDGGPIGVVLAVALLLVFAFSLSWVWTALGLCMPTPEAVMQTGMTVLFPLTFASNVFVDPATMPGWVQAFVNNNPITHLATATRGLMHGDAVGGRHRVGAGLERGARRRVRAPDDAPVLEGALSGRRLGVAHPRRPARVDPRARRGPRPVGSGHASQGGPVSDALAALLAPLSSEERAVLVLRDILGWDLADVAELLGLRLDAANCTLLRARTAVRASSWRPAYRGPAGGPVKFG